jgi:hypothetical protein
VWLLADLVFSASLALVFWAGGVSPGRAAAFAFGIVALTRVRKNAEDGDLMVASVLCALLSATAYSLLWLDAL